MVAYHPTENVFPILSPYPVYNGCEGYGEHPLGKFSDRTDAWCETLEATSATCISRVDTE